MMTTRLSAKGQLTIPKKIRSARGWSKGLEFTVQETGNGLLLIPLPLFDETTLADVPGCTGYQRSPKSLEAMEEAIARGAREAS
ncbi:MAG: AbrB/MazE/SpoVT family DNA-binding domain-containing protein [Anaerolineales bacterium]|nr:AbrB/MazE/SpoVT family DNA-binding domain-containing protein [Anaerolineales bacterium]